MSPRPLTRLQLGVLRALAEGYSHVEIAAVLGCTRQAVQIHLNRARDKLGARTIPHLVALALRRGLIR